MQRTAVNGTALVLEMPIIIDQRHFIKLNYMWRMIIFLHVSKRKIGT